MASGRLFPHRTGRAHIVDRRMLGAELIAEAERLYPHAVTFHFKQGLSVRLQPHASVLLAVVCAGPAAKTFCPDHVRRLKHVVLCVLSSSCCPCNTPAVSGAPLIALCVCMLAQPPLPPACLASVEPEGKSLQEIDPDASTMSCVGCDEGFNTTCR